MPYGYYCMRLIRRWGLCHPTADRERAARIAYRDFGALAARNCAPTGTARLVFLTRDTVTFPSLNSTGHEQFKAKSGDPALGKRCPDTAQLRFFDITANRWFP